ncbi:hypothetical protein [Burkholderia sp. Bp8990]|uniref:hypothetical protein n=1 Tax=Burkholderia sp. Bp8990 TaxID=2184552 RepID=UPI000F5B1B71|nr:hypothetical protein [Burkholderia sp. Bp8990]RQS39758.1 hypothetical protein DIE01_16225 [Burkholderia sp. Bp8990]
MKKYVLAALGLIVFIALLASCGERPAPVAQVIQQPAPQVAQVAPAPVVVQPSNDGFWQGLMLGHLMNGGPSVVHHYDSRPAYVAPRSTTIVNNTTVVNKTVVRPSAPVSSPRPSTTYSAPHATSYAGSYSARSSYSSYSSRSSYSGSSYSRR